MSSASTQYSLRPATGEPGAAVLSPGLYVASRKLNMTGMASLGSHQFVFVIHMRTGGASQSLKVVEGHRLVIYGAYSVSGQLKAVINADSDTHALTGFLRGSIALDIDQVQLELEVEAAAFRLEASYQTYLRRSSQEPIPYPKDGGLVGLACASATTFNSNSWAQSLIEHTFGPGRVRKNFAGFDICFDSRIPPKYFR